MIRKIPTYRERNRTQLSCERTQTTSDSNGESSLIFNFPNSGLATNILDVDRHLSTDTCLRMTYQGNRHHPKSRPTCNQRWPMVSSPCRPTMPNTQPAAFLKRPQAPRKCERAIPTRRTTRPHWPWPVFHEESWLFSCTSPPLRSRQQTRRSAVQDRPPVLQHRPEGIESAVVACEMRGLACRQARQGTVRSGKESGEQEKECKTSVEWRLWG